ncbi:MAG: VOC family protein [Streptosporangiales bacterium]
MITAVHTLIYADDADAARAFFRDVIGWPHVDAHDGWLIFRTGPSELGVHPTATDGGEEPSSTGKHHEVTLMCDDIERTVAELTAKGATFTGGITEQDFGYITTLRIPGADEMLLYQAKHPSAYDL